VAFTIQRRQHPRLGTDLADVEPKTYGGGSYHPTATC
jgi:hypothetical protein